MMADRWEVFKAVTVASENIDCQGEKMLKLLELTI